MKQNFVAFDFETACGKSPCSIGIIEYRDGVIVDEYYTLINPEVEKFNWYATRVHGITKNQVINEKRFSEIWLEIERFFVGKVLVAHNSSFDNSVLNYSLKRYSINQPIFDCRCTLKMARNLIDLPNYKLSTLAQFFNIPQNNYHNALEDAYVCGEVFKKLNEVKNENPKRRGKEINPQKFLINDKSKKSKTSKLKIPYLKESDCLTGFNVVISGIFENFSREEIKNVVELNGGNVRTSISGKTDYLVAGENMGPSKLAKAEKLGTKIVSEDEFLKMLE